MLELLELEAKYNKTIKKHKYYKVKTSSLDENYKPVFRTYKREIDNILVEFKDECEFQDNGIYRNCKKNLSPYQKHWYKWLLENTEPIFMLTIKLPFSNQSGYKRTKNYEKAKYQYRKIIRLIEQEYCNCRHWERHPLNFVGIYEHGKSGFWHVHLLIMESNNTKEAVYKQLKRAINNLIKRLCFYNTVFSLEIIYDKKGICRYLVKELKKPSKDTEYTSNIFNLKIWFNTKTTTPFIIYAKLKQLKKDIKKAFYMKQKGLLQKPNPINKLFRKYRT